MSHSVVIGGAGFVGSWVVDEILEDPGATVTIIDNLMSSEKWNISHNARVTFIEGSASEFATFEKIMGKVDFVFQLACFHGNQSSIVRPLDDLENGLKTTLMTLEWLLRKSPSTRLIYSGAGCAVAEKTWDTPNAVREEESTSLLHDSPYSITKITGEMYCLYYAKQHNLDVVRVRFQNVYGPREILGAGQWRGTNNTIWRNVIPSFIYKAITNQPIEIFGDSATRDFTFVEDVAKIVVEVAKRATSNSLYNIASGKETFIHTLAEQILFKCDSNSQILLKDKRSWDNSGRRFGDTSRLQHELGLRANTSIEDGLNLTIAWTIENLHRIKDVIEKHNK